MKGFFEFLATCGVHTLLACFILVFISFAAKGGAMVYSLIRGAFSESPWRERACRLLFGLGLFFLGLGLCSFMINFELIVTGPTEPMGSRVLPISAQGVMHYVNPSLYHTTDTAKNICVVCFAVAAGCFLLLGGNRIFGPRGSVKLFPESRPADGRSSKKRR